MSKKEEKAKEWLRIMIAKRVKDPSKIPEPVIDNAGRLLHLYMLAFAALDESRVSGFTDGMIMTLVVTFCAPDDMIKEKSDGRPN